MKLSLYLLLATYLLGYTESITTKDEIISKAKLLSSKLVNLIKPKKIQCTEDLKLKKNGVRTCYGFSTGTLSSAFNQSIYDPDNLVKTIYTPENSLLNGMFYHYGIFDVAASLMRYPGVNFMMMLMDEEPKCETVILSASKVGDVLSGPADMLMTRNNAVADITDWYKSKSGSFSPPLPFNVGLGISVEKTDFQSIQKGSEKAVGTRFSAGPRQECTPYLVRVAHVCKKVAVTLVLSKNDGDIALQRHFKKVQPKATFLLPINGVDKDNVHTISGCITDWA